MLICVFFAVLDSFIPITFPLLTVHFKPLTHIRILSTITSCTVQGAFLCSGDLANAGDSSNGSTFSLCIRAASAHHSNCEKHLDEYFLHCSISLLSLEVSTLPSRSKTSCAFGICIIAETGKHPNSLSVVRNDTPARVPPH